MAKRKSNTKKNLSRTQRDRIAGRIMNGWHACERGDTKAAHELLNKAYKEVMEMKTGWLGRNPTTYDDGFKDGIEYGLEHCGVTKIVGRYKLKRALKKGRASEIKKQIAELETGRKAARKEAAARIGKNPAKRVGKQTTYRGHRIRLFRVDIGAEAADPRISYEAEIFYKGTVSWYERGRTAIEATRKAKRWVDGYWERETGTVVRKAGKKKVKRKNPDRSNAIISAFMRGA